MEDERALRRLYRLLPGETVRWVGRPDPEVPRPRRFRLVALFFGAIGLVSALFAALLAHNALPGAGRSGALATLAFAFAAAILIAPGVLLDPCEFLLTDRRAYWRRGRIVRSVDLAGLSYARIRWHRSARGVGTLELVRAVPFGPLARKQRLVFHDVATPDRLLTDIRGVTASPGVGDDELPLAQRLDEGEQVVWGGHPEGALLGLPEIAVALLGLGFVVFGLRYGHVVGGILIGLEGAGLSVQSWTWALFFGAMGVSWLVFVGLGAGFLWHGFWRARALGRATEYLLTTRRLLIRRGRTELSVDRSRIVDVAEAPGPFGMRNVFLVLDDPESRALATSGALSRFPPPRDAVPPVLYELRDPTPVARQLGRPVPEVRDAA